MTALARRMRDRGHEVTVFSVPDAEAAVRAAGLELRPVGAAEFPAGSAKRTTGALGKLSGVAAMKFTVEEFRRAIAVFVRDTGTSVDGLVIDQVALGASLAAEARRIPYVSVFNAMPVLLHPSAPLCIYGWGHRTGALARLRNRIGHALFRQVRAPIDRELEAHAERLGVAANSHAPDAGLSRLAQIAQIPAAFDFPNPELPPYFYYTGPFHDGRGRIPVSFPWERLNGGPLIYASMGTLQNGSERVFRTIAQACSGLGAQVVLSLGGNLAPERLGPLPADVIAVPQAPQMELLERATLCITHAGLNTTLESLAQGVPMVAIPVTNDQPGVAARIRHCGAGEVASLRRLRPQRLRQTVCRVLMERDYRVQAQRMRDEIRAADGLNRAAEIIERSLPGGQRVRRHTTAWRGAW